MAAGGNQVWISVSDMMTGLMMVFLFVSVVFMEQIDQKKQSVQRIAQTYQDYQDDLHQSLIEEFKDDLTRWQAGILEDGTVRFYEPDVLFDQGSKNIKPRFQVILAEFFPRYIGVLSSAKYRNNIEEVRIEGHTSTTWEESRSLEERYLNNALLSQQRSFAILDYCFRLPHVREEQGWLTKVLRANGLAFAAPVMNDGREDEARSRRVEFKVRTKADDKIREIIHTFKDTAPDAPDQVSQAAQGE